MKTSIMTPIKPLLMDLAEYAHDQVIAYPDHKLEVFEIRPNFHVAWFYLPNKVYFTTFSGGPWAVGSYLRPVWSIGRLGTPGLH